MVAAFRPQQSSPFCLEQNGSVETAEALGNESVRVCWLRAVSSLLPGPLVVVAGGSSSSPQLVFFCLESFWPQAEMTWPPMWAAPLLGQGLVSGLKSHARMLRG